MVGGQGRGAGIFARCGALRRAGKPGATFPPQHSPDVFHSLQARGGRLRLAFESVSGRLGGGGKPGKWALDDPGSNLSYTPDSARSLLSGSL